MVSAQRVPTYASHGATALAQPLSRPIPVAPPRVRAIPRSRRREYQAWMSVLIMGCGLLLSLGVLSLYGRICQTREINRRVFLNSQLKLAHQRGEELTVRQAKSETDAIIAEQAANLHMIRRTDRDAVTIP